MHPLTHSPAHATTHSHAVIPWPRVDAPHCFALTHSESARTNEEMASVSALSGAGRGGGYPVFDDAPFINQPVLILDGGTDNFPIEKKWIR